MLREAISHDLPLAKVGEWRVTPRQLAETTYYAREWYNTALYGEGGHRHVYVTMSVERCCNDADGGTLGGKIQACLMENTGQTDINSQTISRCTQITAPRPDTALACAANPDADICGVEDVEGLIELEASEAPGQALLLIATPASSKGFFVGNIKAYDCLAPNACCPARARFNADGSRAGLTTDDDGDGVPWWSLLVVSLVLLTLLGLAVYQIVLLRKVAYGKLVTDSKEGAPMWISQKDVETHAI